MQANQVTQILCLVALAVASVSVSGARARRDWGRASAEDRMALDEAYSAVIPSPNQEFGYPDDQLDIMRRTEPSPQATATTLSAVPVPVYASQYPRAENPPTGHEESISLVPETRGAQSRRVNADESESEDEAPAADSQDLKVAASYGHGHHKHHGSKGWLDMGAYSGPKGAFGWHAKYPVGGKKHGY